MSARLYGIGVGPGDPGLLTLAARDLLAAAAYIAVPVKQAGEDSTALGIIGQTVDLTGKQLIELVFPMEHKKEAMARSHQCAADRLCAILDGGDDVCMITLGDVSVYSTCSYVLDIVRTRGYDTQVIAGVPSFCAGADAAGLSLGRGHENFAVISSFGDPQEVCGLLDTCRTVVFMKAGSRMPQLLQLLADRDLLADAVVISNTGMADAYIGPPDPGRRYGYFTTLIVRKGEGG